jgi:hypothetical protein
MTSVRAPAALAGLALTLGGCAHQEPPAVRKTIAAHQYQDLLPTDGRVPVFTGYQFELLPAVEARECAVPGASYTVATAGVSGNLTRGELAAVQKALATAHGGDLLLISRSSSYVDASGNPCGVVAGRPIRLKTVDLPVERPAPRP